jgi:hypothetical protein
MCESTENVLLFAFRDAAGAGRGVAAARELPGLRSVALVARSSDVEVRIVGGADAKTVESRWVAPVLAVLDALSGPLRDLAGRSGGSAGIALPDSDAGIATFGRLVSPESIVVMVAAYDDSMAAMDAIADHLGVALFRLPAERAVRHADGAAAAVFR